MNSTTNISLSKLHLTNFRNYKSASFGFHSDIVAIFGLNGVGKTNILEAITLLAKGKGLRGADFDDIIRNDNNALGDGFTIYCQLDNHAYIDNIGTSYSKREKKRIFQVNGNTGSGKDFPAVIWLTPQMDSIFLGAKADRRKFLDAIVGDIDANHRSRINAYDKLLRERMNLLEKYDHLQHNKWLDVIEIKIAELGSAIAIARNDALEYLNQAILLSNSDFIKTKVKIIGEIEEAALNVKAIELEQQFAQRLKENRGLDAKIGRTNCGVHRSDFTAILLDKNLEAKFCSTGEQKSILVALTFVLIRMLSLLNLPSAILLLDEIVSHLDSKKKEQLFCELSKLSVQTFLTGTSKELFMQLNDNCNKTVQFLELFN